jgi:hypothetical protein
MDGSPEDNRLLHADPREENPAMHDVGPTPVLEEA